MQDLRKESFELNNLPYDACLNHLTENEHRIAFLKTFSYFLLANELHFNAAEDISINAENKLEWFFDSKQNRKENLMNLAELAYDSWNMKFEIIIDQSLKILVVMDPVYYAKL